MLFFSTLLAAALAIGPAVLGAQAAKLARRTLPNLTPCPGLADDSHLSGWYNSLIASDQLNYTDSVLRLHFMQASIDYCDYQVKGLPGVVARTPRTDAPLTTLADGDDIYLSSTGRQYLLTSQLPQLMSLGLTSAWSNSTDYPSCVALVNLLYDTMAEVMTDMIAGLHRYRAIPVYDFRESNFIFDDTLQWVSIVEYTLEKWATQPDASTIGNATVKPYHNSDAYFAALTKRNPPKTMCSWKPGGPNATTIASPSLSASSTFPSFSVSGSISGH